MFVGRPPFIGEAGLNVLAKHIVEIPALPSARNAALGTAYDEILLKALAKVPLDRYRTAGAFREALARAHGISAEPDRILVADDDQDWRDIIASVLRERFPKAVVDVVSDGVSALDAFCDHPYSVVLVDLDMPEMDGSRLTHGLRSIEGARRTAIVVLTAAGGPSEWRRLCEIGADAFLVKPVDVDDVERVIRRTFLARRRPPTMRS
jgi:CheY-like chemotaxis protein